MKKLEVAGMASVAASRALESGVHVLSTQGSNLLNSIQQPLPQSALISPPSLDLPRLPPPLDLPRVPPILQPRGALPPFNPNTTGRASTITSTERGLTAPPQLDMSRLTPSLAQRERGAPPQLESRTHRPQQQDPRSQQRTGPAPQEAQDSPPYLDDLHGIPASPLEDADEQISQLLKSLHQQPVIKTEEEKMADIFDSLSSSTLSRKQLTTRPSITKSPDPPVITSVKSVVKASGIFHENAPSPSMPVLLPQVPLSEAAVAASRIEPVGFQNTYLDSLARSQIGDKRGAAARSRNISGPAPSQSLSFNPISNAVQVAAAIEQSAILANKPLSVIQQTPRFDLNNPPSVQTVGGPPPNITIQTSISAGPGIGMGGAGSQIRAMQHAPPNTRLVRGPNGQVTLQKVQTIELSQEMQQVCLFHLIKKKHRIAY